MSAPPVAPADELLAWTARLSSAWEGESLRYQVEAIRRAIALAQNAPPTLDRRSNALVITKLEEAEHWALHCLRLAVARELADKGAAT